MPPRRVAGKTSPTLLEKLTEDHYKAILDAKDAADAKEFWEGVASDLGRHRDKAAKLAETARNTELLRKLRVGHCQTVPVTFKLLRKQARRLLKRHRFDCSLCARWVLVSK